MLGRSVTESLNSINEEFKYTMQPEQSKITANLYKFSKQDEIIPTVQMFYSQHFFLHRHPQKGLTKEQKKS